MNSKIASDNGGRRFTGDRRRTVSLNFSPEKRSGNDRRRGKDRRSPRYQNLSDIDRRSVIDIL